MLNITQAPETRRSKPTKTVSIKTESMYDVAVIVIYILNNDVGTMSAVGDREKALEGGLECVQLAVPGSVEIGKK